MKLIAISGKARSGKTTTANLIKGLAEKDGKSAIVVSYGGYVKYACSTYLGWDGNKNIDGRTLLQNIGDGSREKHGEGFWMNKLISDILIFCKDYNYVIIDDCRYPNEILIPKTIFNTTSIRINRIDFESDLTEEQKNNGSEIAMDDFKTDYKIDCLSGVENLYEPVKLIYESVKCGD